MAVTDIFYCEGSTPSDLRIKVKEKIAEDAAWQPDGRPVPGPHGWTQKMIYGAPVGSSTATLLATDIDAGASGTAGTVDVFPATASKGKLQIAVTDQTGNTTVSLQVAAMAAARTISLVDPLANANILTGIQSSVARTATASGATTGTIADAGYWQFVTVTCDDANKIIILPTPTPGVVVILRNGATGYELRSSDPATIAINGGAGAAAESAIAASTMVLCVCTSATTWQAIGLAATTLAAVEAAAA